MGYTTDFSGRFNLNKKLTDEDHLFLMKLASTRRMARKVGPEFGVEGEFFVDGKGHMGQDVDPTILQYDTPPDTQPGLWLQWVPTDDGMGLEWDGNEKFYAYFEWLVYLIDVILKPRGYIVDGKVYFRGEDFNDFGTIVVKKNVVVKSAGQYP